LEISKTLRSRQWLFAAFVSIYLTNSLQEGERAFLEQKGGLLVVIA
jgi:hypothetical protein